MLTKVKKLIDGTKNLIAAMIATSKLVLIKAKQHETAKYLTLRDIGFDILLNFITMVVFK